MAAIFGIGSCRKVMPNTDPWYRSEELEKLVKEKETNDDGAVGSGMLESALILDTSSVYKTSKSTNEFIANAVDLNEFPRLSHRLKRNVSSGCVKAKTRTEKNGIVYIEHKCHSHCYPVYRNIGQGQVIVAKCQKTTANG